MTNIVEQLEVLLANTYALYLKTQNYHWHVKGSRFKELHDLFEHQYQIMAESVDEIAERILIAGHHAPATFKQYEKLKRINDGDSHYSPDDMLADLSKDHDILIHDLNQLIAVAQEKKDEGLVTVLSDRVAVHQKLRWMLNASKSV